MKAPQLFTFVNIATTLFSLWAGLAQADGGSSGAIPPELAGDDCDSFVSGLPATFTRGYVTVPEDWDHPEGRKIRVFYYARTQSTEAHTPVVFFNGGPSASSHTSYATLEGGADSAKAPFVYIDQRGNGCSDPYPSEPTAETAERLTHYGSRAIVRDAEEVRKTLFGADSKWRVFGQSYGALIVHRYLTIAPQSVEAAYAHGYAVMSDSAEWLKLRIASQKRVSDDYFAKYPADRDAIFKLRQLIGENVCFDNEGTQACGPALVDALNSSLGFQESWDDLHWWVGALLEHPEYLTEMLLGFTHFYLPDFTHSHFANSVINRVEIARGSSDREECIEALKRLKAAGEDPESWPINECRILSSLRNPQIDPLVETVQATDPLTIADVQTALARNPSIQLFLYSGQKDVFVPVETFKEELNALGSRVRYVNFPGSGHEGFHSEQQVWSDLLSD